MRYCTILMNKLNKNITCILFMCVILLLVTSTTWAQQDDPCTIAAYELSLAINHVTCPGESTASVTVSSTGCNCFYSGCTFQWSSGEIYHTADKLSAGTYSVTITHPDGCVMDTSVVVTEPEPFVQNIERQHVQCSGLDDGSATIVPSSLAGPLQYAWSDGQTTATASSLAAGEYEVTVTNFIGCSHVEAFTIDAAEEADLTVTTKETCEGGKIGEASVEIEGGTPPYTYKWNSGDTEATATQLGAGDYIVTVTDANGCEFVSQRAVVQQAAFHVAASAQENFICRGNGVELTAIGGEMYEWSPSIGLNCMDCPNPMANPSETTIYTVAVETVDGCKSEAQVTVQVLDEPQPSIMTWNEVICSGESTQLIATEPSGATFNWSPSTGLSNDKVNSPLATPTETTTYTVTATNAAGCSSTTEITIHVEDCTSVGVEDGIGTKLAQMLQVQPNPSQGVFAINYELATPETVHLKVFNTIGQLIYQELNQNEIGTLNKTLDLSTQPRGLYYIELTVGGEQYVEKMLLN